MDIEMLKRMFKDYPPLLDVLNTTPIDWTLLISNIKKFQEKYNDRVAFEKATHFTKHMTEALEHLVEHGHLLDRQPSQGMSRRDFLRGTAAMGAAAAFSPFMSREAHAQQLTIGIFESDLLRKSPYEIMKDTHQIETINYDPQGMWKESYLSAVFQDGQGAKKPVLSLFIDLHSEEFPFEKTAATIFKHLTYAPFAKDLKFICMNLPGTAKPEYALTNIHFGGNQLNPMGDRSNRTKRMLPPIRGPPSFVLHSPHHYLKGEKIDAFMLVDISWKSPYDPQNSLNKFNNLTKWVTLLLYSPLSNGQTYMYENTDKIHPI